MSVWEEFEIQCTDFLNDRFGTYASFFHKGGSDSTVPDIFAEPISGNSFYIEAKHSPAQCGQFVLLPNIETGAFEYSEHNVHGINQYSQMILDHMNSDFDAFRNAGTAGKDIIMPSSSDIFAGWIIQTYKEKGVEFIITNGYTILPIEQIGQYFDVTATYRIKKSGSGNVGKSHLQPVMNYLSTQDYSITDVRISKDKLFLVSPQQLHDQRFMLRGIEYMFSLRGDEYELRRLSNTNNGNVIFSIQQKSHVAGMSDEAFIARLR